MEKVIEQLDNIISCIPTAVPPTNKTDMQKNMLDRPPTCSGPSTSTVDGILDVCKDQARKIRELTEDNAHLRETIRQLKSALNFAHELTVSVSADKKAARGSLMEIERQLEIALREKRALEDALQRANVYINEARKKMLAEERKNEQTQTKLNELKERCDTLQKEYKRCNHWNTGNKDVDKNPYWQQKSLPLPSKYPPGSKTKEQFDELQLDYNRKLAEKNKEINELVEKSRRQTDIILQQGAEISSLQERIEQLESNNPRPFTRPCADPNPVRSFFRRSFTVHRKKLHIQKDGGKEPLV